jgi:hypothetical protein
MNETEAWKKRKKFLEQVPDLHRPALERVYFGNAQKSRALAVKLKCLDCCCYQREEVRHCRAVTCPLWGIRPFQTKGGTHDE